MKIQSIIMGALLLGNGPIAFAINPSTSQQILGNSGCATCKLIPKAMLLYTFNDFTYDSSAGANFTRFQGHTNLYSAGADQIQIYPNLYAGVGYYRADTSLDWQMSLIAGEPTTSSQTIHNNSIFAHILKAFNCNLYLDLAGAFGQNRVNTTSLNNTPEVATSSYDNHNWFVNANAIYTQPWGAFDFTATAGVLYSQVDNPSYGINVTPPGITIVAEALKTQVTMITENAEIGYSVTPKFRPFINAGLFQVVNYDNSRALFAPTSLVGAAPQLFIDQNGFKAGGGIGWKCETLNLRIEEKYYNAGGKFINFMTMAELSYRFDTPMAPVAPSYEK